MKTDADFRQHAEEALHSLRRLLAPVGDDFGFEVSVEAGALELEFDSPLSPITVSFHPAQRQAWLVSGGKTHRLTWDIVENSFQLEATGQTLQEVLEEAISERVGEDVSL